MIVRAVRRDKNTPQRRGSNLFNFDDNINNLRPNQLPGALKGTCCKDNSGQLGCQLMSIRGYILLGWKNALGALATQTKYIVIGGQNKKYNNEYYNSVVSFLWTRFYNNAAKSSCNC